MSKGKVEAVSLGEYTRWWGGYGQIRAQESVPMFYIYMLRVNLKRGLE